MHSRWPDNSFKEELIWSWQWLPASRITYKINDRLAVFAPVRCFPIISRQIQETLAAVRRNSQLTIYFADFVWRINPYENEKNTIMLWMAVSLMVSFAGCTSEEMDYENPNVKRTSLWETVEGKAHIIWRMKEKEGNWKFLTLQKRTFPNYWNMGEEYDYYSFFPSVYNTNNGRLRFRRMYALGNRSLSVRGQPVIGLQNGTGKCRQLRSAMLFFDDEVLDAATAATLSPLVGRPEISENILDNRSVLRTRTALWHWIPMVVKKTSGGIKLKHEATFICNRWVFGLLTGARAMSKKRMRARWHVRNIENRGERWSELIKRFTATVLCLTAFAYAGMDKEDSLRLRGSCWMTGSCICGSGCGQADSDFWQCQWVRPHNGGEKNGCCPADPWHCPNRKNRAEPDAIKRTLTIIWDPVFRRNKNE